MHMKKSSLRRALRNCAKSWRSLRIREEPKIRAISRIFYHTKNAFTERTFRRILEKISDPFKLRNDKCCVVTFTDIRIACCGGLFVAGSGRPGSWIGPVSSRSNDHRPQACVTHSRCYPTSIG